MATSDPLQPSTTTSRTEYNMLQPRSSHGGMWAFLIVLLLVVAAGVLYFTGFFNRSLSTETNKVDIKVHAPAAPAPQR